MAFRVTQGDQYNILLRLDANGEPIPLDKVSLIEFTVGTLSKLYPTEVQYDGEQQQFLFPVTQEETFLFNDREMVQARIKYTNGDVIGTPQNQFPVRDSLSKNII